MKIKDTVAEDRLIRLCINPDFNENIFEESNKILSDDLNWEYFFRKSQDEGVSLLIYHRLNSIKLTDRIPKYIQEPWQREYYANAARNALIFSEAKEILDLFNREGIKVIVLKGIFFAEQIYKNIALRPMSDADIVIKKEDLERVNTILGSLGYISSPSYADFSKEKLVPFSINSLAYKKDSASNFFIHLHWHLINSTWPLDSLVSAIDMERIWANADSVSINGVNAFMLSAEHHLLYLAQHGFNHSFSRLIFVSDILEFLKCYRDKLDWRVVIEEAERFNLYHILYYSLSLASQRVGYVIPELNALKPPKISFPDKVSLFLMNKRISVSLSAYFTYLLMQDGLASQLRFIKKTLFPPKYVMAHSCNIPSAQINIRHYYRRIVNRCH